MRSDTAAHEYQCYKWKLILHQVPITADTGMIIAESSAAGGYA